MLDTSDGAEFYWWYLLLGSENIVALSFLSHTFVTFKRFIIVFIVGVEVPNEVKYEPAYAIGYPYFKLF